MQQPGKANRPLLFLITGLVLVLSLLMYSDPAAAQGEPACSATINDEPISGETVSVDRDSDVDLRVVAPSGPAENSVYVEFFGKQFKIDSVTSNGGEWSGTIGVQKYARWGVGLYNVVWESRSPEGQIICKGSTSIRVAGFPLGSVAGAAGAAAVAIGLTALTITAKTTINEGGRWAIKVVTKAKPDRDKEQQRLRLKPTISVSQTLLSTLWGLLLSGGTLTTLQQTALSIPTIELAFQLVIPFTLLSLLAGWFRLVRE